MWLESVVIFLFSSLFAVNSFNLDTENYVRHRGQSSSMFGFTVATHKERGRSWVLVGAPNAQNGQPGVNKGGAVYRCSIDSDDSCQEVPFDGKGHNIDNKGNHIDSKSGQWFGATLSSAGEDGPIVACAPRYVYFSQKQDRRDPVGTCYVARGDFSSYSEYSPCRTAYFGYHRQGSCQAGFSAGISKDARRLFIGGPGSWYWQGQMYSIDAQASFPYTPGLFGGAFGSGQVIQQSLETRPSVFSTRSGNERDDNSYMGYSATVGDFTGDGEQGVAVGMPRGANLYGKIVLFTWNLTSHQNISGMQLGAYFGYAVASGDVDGDKTDDLIIGAPLHTEANNEGKYEVGRVYVVYQGKDSSKRFRRLNTLDGFNSKGRFGLSLAYLGDVNLDGFGDFAVGAPYDGPNERGAVYIYHGGSKVVGNKYSQVIHAEDVSIPGLPLETFGFSVSGGLDLDNNDYPDMAVGSYLTDAAFFFRTRPVVKIDGYVRFMTANKQIILDEKNCTLVNRQAVPCTSIDVCLQFSGVNVPHNIDLDIQYILDAKKTKQPRMFFLSNETKNVLNETFNLQRDSRHICRQKIVYIKHDIRDKLTPLEVEVRYSMRESRSFQHQSHTRNPRSVLLPVLDMNTDLLQRDSISVHKNCGPDNICIPNLRLIAESNVQRYLLGSNEKLIFDVIVQNEGEDSFESTFDLHLPPGVDFNKIIQDEKTEVRILCSSLENNTVRCDIGNPLPARKIVQFKIQMTPYHKEGMKPSYDFSMIVNSTNPENSHTTEDNRIDRSIHIWVDSKLELGGTSRPSEAHYNASLYTSETIQREGDIGPQVIHLYTIKNNGPSSITEAEMLFLWPYATLGGDDLLYLLEQPHTYGNVKCEPAEANYRRYDLDVRKKSIWETMGIDVSKGDFSTAAGQTGGIVIEEGEGTHGSLGGEKVLTKFEHEFKQTGDASLEHEQRGKKPVTDASGSGTRVIVTEDTGSGSTVHEEHSWTSGPTVTHTHMKNTSYIGPDGKMHYKVTYQQGGQGGQGGGYSQSFRNESYIGSDGKVHYKVTYLQGQGGDYSQNFRNESYIGSDGKVHYKVTHLQGGQGGIGGGYNQNFRNESYIGSDGKVHYKVTYLQGQGGQGGGYSQNFRNESYIGSDGKVHYKVTYLQGGQGAYGSGAFQNYRNESYIGSDGKIRYRIIYEGEGSQESLGEGYSHTYIRNTSYVTNDGKLHYKLTYSKDGNFGAATVLGKTVGVTYVRNTTFIGPDGRVQYKINHGVEGPDGIMFTGGSTSFKQSFMRNSSYIGPDGKVHYKVTYGEGWPEDIPHGAEVTSTGFKQTIMRNTSYIGPDGKVHYKVTYEHGASGSGQGSGFTSSGDSTHFSQSGGGTTHMTSGSSSGEFTHTSSGGTAHASSGGSSHYSTSGSTSGSSSGTHVRPNLIYTSTGRQQGQTGNHFSSSSSTASSGSGRIDQNGNYPTSETRQSGQSINSAEGGRTVYAEGHYQGHLPTAPSKNFNWDGHTSGRDEHRQTYGSAGTSATENRNYEEERRRIQAEEERRRLHAKQAEEDARRIHEEEERRRIHEEEERRRMHEERGYDDGHTDEERRRIYEERRRIQEEQRRRIQEEDERRRIYEEEYRRKHQQETQTSGVDTSKNVYPDNYDLPYSSEEYYGSVENNAYDEDTGATGAGSVTGSRGHNRSESSHWSQQGGQHDNRNLEHAAAGHGFRTSTLDLGALGGQNEASRHSSSGHSSQGYGQEGVLGAAAQGHGFRTTGLDLGALEGGHSESSSKHGSSSYGQHGGGLETSAQGHGFRTSGADLGHTDSTSSQHGGGGSSNWGTRTETRWSASGTGPPPSFIGRDNVPTDRPDYSNRFHGGRRKREIIDTNDIDIRNVMECKATKCLMVRCTVGPLKKDQDAIIALRSRINIRALKNITSQPMSVSSMMLARISKLPYIGTPLDRQIHSHEIFTTIPAPDPDIKPDIVPLWVVVLSAVAGTIILLLLIFLLYKCGFFKRNRPSDAPERQPLNRNGYYNADAAL